MSDRHQQWLQDHLLGTNISFVAFNKTKMPNHLNYSALKLTDSWISG
jgi:hypothetical protein